MAQDLVIGKYHLRKSDNFENFLKQLNLGFLVRKAACLASPTVTIEQDEDVWTLRMNSTFSNNEIKFKLDEEFDEKRQDGSYVKTTVTMKDGKLIQVQRGAPCGKLKSYAEQNRNQF